MKEYNLTVKHPNLKGFLNWKLLRYVVWYVVNRPIGFQNQERAIFQLAKSSIHPHLACKDKSLDYTPFIFNVKSFFFFPGVGGGENKKSGAFCSPLRLLAWPVRAKTPCGPCVGIGVSAFADSGRHSGGWFSSGVAPR